MQNLESPTEIGSGKLRGEALVPTLFLASLLLITLGPFLASTLSFVSLALLLQVVALSHVPKRPISVVDLLLVFFVFSLEAGEIVTNPNLDNGLELIRWLAILLIARNLIPIFGTRAVLTSFVILAMGLSLTMVISLGFNLGLAMFDESRIAPLFMHKNDLGTLVGIGSIALFSRLLQTQRSGRTAQKMVEWVSFGFLQLTLFFLDSLTALGASLLGLIGLVLVRVSRHSSPPRRRLALLGYLASPFLAVVIGQVSGLFERLGRRSDFHGRLEIWAFTVSDWGGLWAFGAPGNYWTAERSRAFDESTPLVGPVMASDNSFLDIFLDHGILPLVILVAIVVFWLVRLFRPGPNGTCANSFAFSAILYYLLVTSFFSSTLLSPYIFLPFGTALFACASTETSNQAAPSVDNKFATREMPHPLDPRGVESG